MNEPSNKSDEPTIVELLIICVLVGVLAAIAIPNFIKPRARYASPACINNLRQIDAAANEMAFEKGLKIGDKINYPDDLKPYAKLNSAGEIPSCPSGGTYSLKKVGDKPTCSLGNTVVPAHVLP
jgi:type II secretory pathway pseudopilin PulG